MVNRVHYLIKDPHILSGLLYPSEVNDPYYYTVGNFFILGRPSGILQKEYTFYAIKESEISEYILDKNETENDNDENIFKCNINKLSKVGFISTLVNKFKRAFFRDFKPFVT